MKEFIQHTGESIATIFRLFLFSSGRGILNTSEIPKSERCIIIGNGPSFRTSVEKYAEDLKKNQLLCVNNFAVTPFYEEFKPVFYVLNANVLFYPDEKISQLYIDIRKNLFKAIEEKTTWDLYMMVPFIAKKSVEFNKILSANPRIKPLYFNQTPAEGYTFFKHFLFRKGLGIPRPHNVLIPSIMNLIKLGYKEIYMIGADHSWLGEITVNEKNEALVNQKHFYDENESRPEKMEDYITRPRRLHEMVHKFYLSFKGYWEIYDFAQKEGVHIYNSSEISMIDAFERRKPDQIRY